jgi:hypothetical protein
LLAVVPSAETLDLCRSCPSRFALIGSTETFHGIASSEKGTYLSSILLPNLTAFRSKPILLLFQFLCVCAPVPNLDCGSHGLSDIFILTTIYQHFSLQIHYPPHENNEPLYQVNLFSRRSILYLVLHGWPSARYIKGFFIVVTVDHNVPN